MYQALSSLHIATLESLDNKQYGVVARYGKHMALPLFKLNPGEISVN